MEAANERALGTVLALLHEDVSVEFDTPLVAPRARYDGHDGIRAYFADVARAGLDVRGVVEEVRVKGDEALMISRAVAEGPDGGGFASRSAVILRFRGEKIERLVTFLDVAVAERVFNGA